MESSYKPGIDGTDNNVKVANRKAASSSSSCFLRVLAIITTLVAIVVMVVSKESKTVALVLVPGLPPLDVQVTAKWQYLSAFTFFISSNIIACVYATASLIFSIVCRSRSKNLGSILLILDLLTAALLFAGIGAAAAIGVIGAKGNEHVRWNKVCDMFGRYCHHLAGSIAVSLIGACTFLLLIVLATLSLHRRSS